MNLLPVELFVRRLPQIQFLMKEFVLIESPSTDRVALNLLGENLRQHLQGLGGEIKIYPQETTGDHFTCRLGSGPEPLLILCHFDTVYNEGTLQRQPYREVDGKIYGPGVLDMKGSIAMLLSALQVIQEQSLRLTRPLTLLFTSDEETGSLTSRELIEELARESAAAFCLEPALASGAIKTARKGTGDMEINVQGVAAHAGIDHARGKNAIEELAHHVLSAQRLSDYTVGTTVNVGVIQGGTRGNVVPDEAHALIDFRVTRIEEAERLKNWLEGLSPVIDGTSLSTKYELNRPPMPRNRIMAQAFEKALSITESLGLKMEEGSTGGGSDANFVAPLGIPVLDGLGGVGDGAHSEREFVYSASLAERTAVLAALMLNW